MSLNDPTEPPDDSDEEVELELCDDCGETVENCTCDDDDSDLDEPTY